MKEDEEVEAECTQIWRKELEEEIKNLLSTCPAPQTSDSSTQHNHQILLSNPTPTTENEKYKNQ